MRAILTMMTDFGTVDGYVAEMKGVILGSAPETNIVDATHDIPPQDVESARLTLARYWRRYPPGTVHLVVVDPGVGSSRAAIAIASEGQFLVGPDNGVLSPALLASGAQVVTLVVPHGASSTFHGRDVFAPAAALLTLGAPLQSLGEPHDHPIVRRTPEARRTDDGRILGEIITIDRFGNAVTNLIAPRGGTLHAADLDLPIRRTYAEGAAGEPLALVGSLGLVEVAVRDGSAARALGLARGSPVTLRPPQR
jgi:S-adenosyl-L-methionine hydrolase (adenosine-forming)